MRVSNNSKRIWIVLVFFVFFLIFVYFGLRVNTEIDDLTKISRQPINFLQSIYPKAKNNTDTPHIEILRIERKLPQQDHADNIILINSKEVARFKSENDRFFDMIGQIPDGKVKFVNEWENTYGFEHYRNGIRDGEYVEYYSNDQLKVNAEYLRGRPMKRKSYFLNGSLRTNEDYSNAEWISNLRSSGKIKEVGIGKIYRIDGSLKYEWYFVDDAEKNYTKTYDSAGNLIEANYYNAQGDLIAP